MKRKLGVQWKAVLLVSIIAVLNIVLCPLLLLPFLGYGALFVALVGVPLPLGFAVLMVGFTLLSRLLRLKPWLQVVVSAGLAAVVSVLVAGSMVGWDDFGLIPLGLIVYVLLLLLGFGGWVAFKRILAAGE